MNTGNYIKTFSLEFLNIFEKTEKNESKRIHISGCHKNTSKSCRENNSKNSPHRKVSQDTNSKLYQSTCFSTFSSMMRHSCYPKRIQNKCEQHSKRDHSNLHPACYIGSEYNSISCQWVQSIRITQFLYSDSVEKPGCTGVEGPHWPHVFIES